jgi:hypothetical protein
MYGTTVGLMTPVVLHRWRVELIATRQRSLYNSRSGDGCGCTFGIFVHRDCGAGVRLIDAILLVDFVCLRLNHQFCEHNVAVI